MNKYFNILLVLLLVSGNESFSQSVGALTSPTACKRGKEVGHAMYEYCDGQIIGTADAKIVYGEGVYAIDEASTGTIGEAGYIPMGKNGCITAEALEGTGMSLHAEVCSDNKKVDPDTCDCVECYKDSHCGENATCDLATKTCKEVCCKGQCRCETDQSCINDACCSTPNKDGTECCDENGKANDGTCCPALTTQGCNTEKDSTTGCLKCKQSAVTDCSGQPNGTPCTGTVRSHWDEVIPVSGYCYSSQCVEYASSCSEFEVVQAYLAQSVANNCGGVLEDFGINEGEERCYKSGGKYHLCLIGVPSENTGTDKPICMGINGAPGGICAE